MTPVEAIPGIGGGRNKGELLGGYEFKYDTVDIL
jgi:hypothetical protein